MYSYWYGWSLGTAGGAGIGALLAALLTAHAHVTRHKPLFAKVCEENLQRPLLRCRSEGCLGGRSCTSDTLRTYLTNDSRRLCGRPCTHGQTVDRSPSIVDLTRSSTEAKAEAQDTSMSNATSDDDIISLHQHQPIQHFQRPHCSYSPATNEQNYPKHLNEYSKVQYHYQHQNANVKQVKHQANDSEIQNNAVADNSNLTAQAIVEAQKPSSSGVGISTPPHPSNSSPSSCSSSTTGNQSSTQQAHHTQQHYLTLQPHHQRNQNNFQHSIHCEKNTSKEHQQCKQPRPHKAHHSSVSSRTPILPPTCPPPPSIPSITSTTQLSLVRQSSSEPPRLPQLNTFTDYSKTLPLKEVRQMAVFNRGNGNRSSTLSRPLDKVSSEV